MPKGVFVRSLEHRRNLSLALRGKVVPQRVRDKISKALTGRHHTVSQATCLKISQANSGNKNCANSGSFKKGHPPLKGSGRGKHGHAICIGKRLSYASSWEQSFLEVCNSAWFIISVRPPRGSVSYKFDGRYRRYFPDFEVVYLSIDRHAQRLIPNVAIVEIKNSYFIDSAIVIAKALAAIKFFGGNYILIPEKITSLEQLKRYLWKDAHAQSVRNVRRRVREEKQWTRVLEKVFCMEKGIPCW
jgi:hypothetical protein